MPEKSIIMSTQKDYVFFYLNEQEFEYRIPRASFFTKHSDNKLIKYLNQLDEEGFKKIIIKNE